MRTKVFFFCTLLVCLIGLVIFFQPVTNAAPLAICISTSGGGDWATASTWQFCTGSNPPAPTDDVYIQGPVTLGALQTAANVTVSNGGSLSSGANTLIANSMNIDAGGYFTGSLTLAGNLTDNGSFNGNGYAVTINGATSIGSGATFAAGNGLVELVAATTNSGMFNAGALTNVYGDLTNQGTFNCDNHTVVFKGNLTNNNILNCGSGTVNMNGTLGQNIGGSGTIALNNLVIDDLAGVTLNKNASVTGTLLFNNGDMNTGVFTLDLSGATLVGIGGGDVVGSVKRTQTFSTGTDYTFNSPNTFINFTQLQTAPTAITIHLVKFTPTGFTHSLPREYEITTSGPTPVFSATLQLHYKSSEVTGGFNEANLRAWRFNPTLNKWVLQQGSQGGSGGNSFVKADTISEFSQWAITDNGAPTAVTLSSFKANAPLVDLGAWLARWFNR